MRGSSRHGAILAVARTGDGAGPSSLARGTKTVTGSADVMALTSTENGLSGFGTRRVEGVS